LFQILGVQSVADSVSAGGTAGLVVANRLTEDANVTVVVLEAGAKYVSLHRSFAQRISDMHSSNAGVQAIDVPLLAPTLNNTQ
jgi:choline dehydrogenase-like flavoprotein